MNGSESGLTNFKQTDIEQFNLQIQVEKNEQEISINLPQNEAQLKHIFKDRKGHLPDTKENRELLVNLANDSTKLLGTDKYGNSWNAIVLSEGKQVWVRYMNKTINEGGINDTPREWDNESGLNNNPKKNNTWRKKKK